MKQWIRSLDAILKGEATKPAALRAGAIAIPAGGLTVLLIILGALYGVCMGTFALVTRWGGGHGSQGLLQMGYSAVKVPMLFFLTLVVTFPSLYVFNALVGCRLLFSTVLKLLLGALGVTLAVLASFGTIVAFFSLCTTSHSFMVLLNVAAFAAAGILGMGFLLGTLRRIAAIQQTRALEQSELPPRPDSGIEPQFYPPAVSAESAGPEAAASPSIGQSDWPAGSGQAGAAINPNVRAIFAVWVIVFGLVGSQMGGGTAAVHRKAGCAGHVLPCP